MNYEHRRINCFFHELPKQLAQLFKDAKIRRPHGTTRVVVELSEGAPVVIQNYRSEALHAKVACSVDTSWNGSDGEWNHQRSVVCASSLALDVEKSYNRHQKHYYTVSIGNISRQLMDEVRERDERSTIEMLEVLADSGLENEPDVDVLPASKKANTR